jgi:hypothetical protein
MARKTIDFPSRPIYGVGERSGIRFRRVVPGDLVAAAPALLVASGAERFQNGLETSPVSKQLSCDMSARGGRRDA